MVERGDEARARQREGLRRVSGPNGAAAPELDRLIHERVRLGMLSALAVNDALSFAELKELLGATDGNLGVHAKKLEEARYVKCTKRFDGRVPRSEYSITRTGRKALAKYLDHMEALIRVVRERS